LDFSLGKDLETFRGEVREFLKPWIVERNGVQQYAGRPVEAEVQRAMGAEGWLDLGAELDMDWNMKTFVFGHEATRLGFHLSGVSTTAMVGFTLNKVATEEQKARWMPGINSGQTRIALGYSEPQGGSDVASCRVRSRREGDEWVIDGQKQWTTSPNTADYICLLTRSDLESRRNSGLTHFMVPTNLPGIHITPIHTMGGERTNAVFFDSVRVPDANRVGEANGGWKVLMVALTYEHGGGNVPSRSLTGIVQRVLDQGIAFARAGGDNLLDDPTVAERLAEIAIEVEIVKLFAYRTSWAGAHSEKADVLGAIAKVFAREAVVRASDKVLEIAGAAGFLSNGEGGGDQGAASMAQQLFLDAPVGTVVGGSVEIQRSVIAERGLGLPKSRHFAPPARSEIKR
jgi:alkylation response protein AidB-like acyl-CoA dehydrogenase